MTFLSRIAGAVMLALPIAGCDIGGENARYLIDPPAAAASSVTRVSVRTVELRDVSLPSHASGSEILIMDETGALRPLGDAVWADDPARAVTSALAQALDARSSATVAAEPWPLLDGPGARLDVRIDRMLARTTGVFEMTGQAAVSAVEGRPRERVERFNISVPLDDVTAASVSNASGRAILALSDELIGLLSR